VRSAPDFRRLSQAAEYSPSVQARAKSALTRLGARCSRQTIHRLSAAVDYLEVGRWMRAHGFEPDRRFARREDIFDAVAAGVADARVLYLEFGVYKGESMRYWSSLLRHPEARLDGFDSFEGLPQSWSLEEGRGHFSTNGRVPEIADERVRFVKGWFEDTLPGYEPPEHDRLVVNVDSDLYSSAALVLRTFEPLIVPGTLVYFDEFHARLHELRAFDEFLEQTGARFAAVAATPDLNHVVFRRLP
jgi:hypothetical protein